MHGYRMMDGYSYSSEPGWAWLVMLVCALAAVGVFLVIVRLIMGQQGHHGMHHMHSEHSVDAMDIVKERYAKGEIDKEQFEQLKKDLTK